MLSIFSLPCGNSRKGETASVLVIGGSPTYAGAPVFAALGAFRAGAEIVYIMTDKAALFPLKAIYDAIVIPFSYNERILKKLTACVIGPGLGRPKSKYMDVIDKVLSYLDSLRVPIVVDGDAIHYYKQGRFSGYKRCVLTPNYKEAINLKVAEHHICIYKGKEDSITAGDRKLNIKRQGSNKRFGGQGDILAGILGVALSLAKEDDYMEACSQSCILLRMACKRSFERLSYSVIASDVLEDLPLALKDLMANGDGKDRSQ